MDGTSEDVAVDYQTIQTELKRYGGELADKPQVVVLNKVDAIDEDVFAERRDALVTAVGGPVLEMSGVARTGTIEVLRKLRALISQEDEVAEDDAWRP